MQSANLENRDCTVECVGTIPEKYPLVSSFPGSYSAICDLSLADGKPLYRAEHGTQYVAVWGEQEGRPYDIICGLTFAGGKPLYYARRRGMDHDYFVVCGEEEGKEYAEIADLTFAGGRPLYRAGGVFQRVVWGNEEGEWCDRVTGITFAGGRPLYRAERDKRCFVIWGSEAGELYDDVTEPLFAEGQPLYCAKLQGRRFVIWGKQISNPHTEVKCPIVVNGMLYYCASDDKIEEMATCFVVRNNAGVEVKGRSYKGIWGLTAVENKPFYFACRKELIGGKWRNSFFLVKGEKEKREVSDEPNKSVAIQNIRSLSIADGKPFYLVYRYRKRNDYQPFVVWGTHRAGPYDRVEDLTFAGGKPLYRAERDWKKFVVWGKEEGESCHTITELSFVGGRPLYRAWRYGDLGGVCAVIWGREVIAVCKEIFSLHTEGDEIVFGARVERKIYRVSRRIA